MRRVWGRGVGVGVRLGGGQGAVVGCKVHGDMRSYDNVNIAVTCGMYGFESFVA